MSYVHDIRWATQGRYWNLPDIGVKGLVIHSVGCPQPKADVFAKNFNSPNAVASIHGVLEPGRFIEMAPIYEAKGKAKKCYHVGSGPKGSRNSTHIGIEMTEPSTIKYTSGDKWIDLDPQATKKFVEEVTATAADVFADLCIFHGLSVNTITTHRQSNLDGYGSAHGDPEHIWKIFGYTLADFRQDVQRHIDSKKGDVLALMTREEFNKILDERLATKADAVVYKTLEDVPDWGKPAVQKLVKAGVLKGTGAVDGVSQLNLSNDAVRIIVMLDRASAFEGLEVKSAPSAPSIDTACGCSVSANIK